MKTKIHPTNNNMNTFTNKENINPLLNYTPNKPNLIKKNAKENFFDEMDQLLNADFWQKNGNRTNYPQKLDPSKNTNNVYNNPFGINVNNNKGMNNLNNFDSLMNIMKNVDFMKKSKGFDLLNKGSLSNTIINNNNFMNVVNQSKQENKLSTIFSNNKNNVSSNFLPNKNENINNQNASLNNNGINIFNKENIDLNNLSNLGTETKNRFLNNNANSSNINKAKNSNNILQLLNPVQPEQKEKSKKIENLEIINSYDMEEVFGSEINSKKSPSPSPSPPPVEDQEKNFFNQPMKVLMKMFPLSSIINFPTLNQIGRAHV